MDPLKLLKIKTLEWYSTNSGISLMAESKNYVRTSEPIILVRLMSWFHNRS